MPARRHGLGPLDGRRTPACSHAEAGAGWALPAVGICSGWFVVACHAEGGHGALGAPDPVALRFGIRGLILLAVPPHHAPALPPQAWRDGVGLVAGSGAPFAWGLPRGPRVAPRHPMRRTQRR